MNIALQTRSSPVGRKKGTARKAQSSKLKAQGQDQAPSAKWSRGGLKPRNDSAATLPQERGLQAAEVWRLHGASDFPDACFDSRNGEGRYTSGWFGTVAAGGRCCGLNRLCENSKTLFLQNEKGGVGTLAARQNAPYRICGGRFFVAEHRRGVFTQSVKAALRSPSRHRYGSDSSSRPIPRPRCRTRWAYRNNAPTPVPQASAPASCGASAPQQSVLAARRRPNSQARTPAVPGPVSSCAPARFEPWPLLLPLSFELYAWTVPSLLLPLSFELYPWTFPPPYRG